MRIIKFLRNPFVIVPLLTGAMLPCVAFTLMHYSAARSPLLLRDAVVISGTPLPTADLLEIDGRSVSPQILRRGRVLLIFLATKCTACERELKLLSSLEGKIGGNVLVCGVSFEERDNITSFLRKNGITTRVLVDKDAALMHQLKVKYFPTKFLIEDGVIVKTWFGTSPDEAELLKQLGL